MTNGNCSHKFQLNTKIYYMTWNGRISLIEIYYMEDSVALFLIHKSSNLPKEKGKKNKNIFLM